MAFDLISMASLSRANVNPGENEELYSQSFFLWMFLCRFLVVYIGVDGGAVFLLIQRDLNVPSINGYPQFSRIIHQEDIPLFVVMSPEFPPQTV